VTTVTDIGDPHTLHTYCIRETRFKSVFTNVPTMRNFEDTNNKIKRTENQ